MDSEVFKKAETLCRQIAYLERAIPSLESITTARELIGAAEDGLIEFDDSILGIILSSQIDAKKEDLKKKKKEFALL